MAHANISDTFESDELHVHWTAWTVGDGVLEHAPGLLRFHLPRIDAQRYSNAQISDYDGKRRAFLWNPPLRLTVHARASHPAKALRGTAGFGFWNEPFTPVGRGMPRLPRAVWFFFGSPPNNMALALGVPGWGWKAATLNATRLPFLLLAPLAPLGFVLMRFPALYRRLWPVGQWALGASEALLPGDLDELHVYGLDWLPDSVVFRVDGEPVHTAPCAPAGPLGFIAWMDNQYAVVTPQGHFRFGLVPVDDAQWLALDRVAIQSLQGDGHGTETFC